MLDGNRGRYGLLLLACFRMMIMTVLRIIKAKREKMQLSLHTCLRQTTELRTDTDET